MKKFFISLIAAAFMFTGCENFLSGSFLDSSIKEQIKYSKASELNVRFSCNPEFGSISSSDGTDLKVGYSTIVRFYKSSNFDSDFIYKGFSSSAKDKIKIEYLNDSNTNYAAGEDSPVTQTARITILENDSDLNIFPSVIVRPKIISVTPENGSDNVPLNASIQLLFNKKIPEGSFNGNYTITVVDNKVTDITDKFSLKHFVSSVPNSLGEYNTNVTFSVKGQDEQNFLNGCANKKLVLTLNDKITDNDNYAITSDNGSENVFEFTLASEADTLAPVITFFEVQTDNINYGYKKIGRSASFLPSSIETKLITTESDFNTFKEKLQYAYYDEETSASVRSSLLHTNGKIKVRLRATDKTIGNVSDESSVVKIHWQIATEINAANKCTVYGEKDYNLESDKEGGICFSLDVPDILKYEKLTEVECTLTFWAEDLCGNGKSLTKNEDENVVLPANYGIALFNIHKGPFDKINEAYWATDKLSLDENMQVTVGNGSILFKGVTDRFRKTKIRLYDGDTLVDEVEKAEESSDVSHLFEGLTNDRKEYTVKYTVSNEEGEFWSENESKFDFWVSRKATPTSGTNCYTVGYGGLTYAKEVQDAYLFDKYVDSSKYRMLFEPLPETEVTQENGKYKIYTTLLVNTSGYEPSSSENWKDCQVYESGQFQWPLYYSSASSQSFYGMLKFEKRLVRTHDELPTDTCYSKVFTMERGTVRANAKFNSVGKWYNSDTDGYKYIVLDTYDNYDPSRPSDTWYPPKTIWSRYNSASESTTKDYSACVSWVSSNKTSKLGSSYDWRLPTADELNLMWKYKSYIENYASLPSDTSTKIVLIGGTSSSDIWRMYYRRGTTAVTEGVAEKSYNTDGYVVWPVATLPRPVYCPNCGAKYYSQSGIDSCKTKEGCAGWTTPCSVCGHKYHTTSEANACGLTKSCPGFKIPVATYQFHNTIELMPAGTDGSAGTTGKYVIFGDWPQTLRDSSVGVYEEYNSIKVGCFTYYVGADGNYYAKKNGNYYKVEPVKWRVLTDNYQNTGNALLTAEAILDSAENYSGVKTEGTAYYYRTINDRKIISNDWEYSWPRAILNGLNLYRATSNTTYDTETQYLNNGMYQTMFNDSGRSFIELTDVVYDEVETGVSGYQGRDTKDYLFILTLTEMNLESYGFNVLDDRSRTATGYGGQSKYCTRTQYEDWGVYNGDWTKNSAAWQECGILPSMTVNSKAIFGDDYVAKDIVSMEITGVTNITPENNAFKFKVKTTNKAAKITVSYKKTSDSSYTTKDLTADADGFYEITGLSDGYIYDVKVKATDASGQESPELSGYKMMTAPAAPAIEEVGAWLDGTIPDCLDIVRSEVNTSISSYKYTVQYGRGVKIANPKRIYEYTYESQLSFRVYKGSTLVKEVPNDPYDYYDSKNKFEIPLDSTATPGTYNYFISSVLKVGDKYIEGPKQYFEFHETCCDLAYVALQFSSASSYSDYIFVNCCALYKDTPSAATPLNTVRWDKNNGYETGSLSNSGYYTKQKEYSSGSYKCFVRSDYCKTLNAFFKYRVYSSDSSSIPVYTFTFTQKTAPQNLTECNASKEDFGLKFVW